MYSVHVQSISYSTSIPLGIRETVPRVVNVRRLPVARGLDGFRSIMATVVVSGSKDSMATSPPPASLRLPSPPPIAEDQISPGSPSVSLFDQNSSLPSLESIDAGATRRIRPGSKAENMHQGPPLVELQDVMHSRPDDRNINVDKPAQLDSAFQLTEHLKALYQTLTHPEDNPDTVRPVSAEIARRIATPPLNTSRDIWLYELGRFLIQHTNAIIVALFSDTPPCSSRTCPEMRASEWQYLCAVHDPPKSCSAIDYCCHTLDWAATTLTSSKTFPSRLGLGSGSGVPTPGDKVLVQQMKEIKNIFRRVYRIYAHAWFQHRESFWRVESKTGLYVFFKTVCDEYSIMESENYTISPEAEGRTASAQQSAPVEVPKVLKRTQTETTPSQESYDSEMLARADTTKRHRNPLNDRASSVSNVIQEEAEEDEEDKRHPISPPSTSEETVPKEEAESQTEPIPEEVNSSKHDDADTDKSQDDSVEATIIGPDEPVEKPQENATLELPEVEQKPVQGVAETEEQSPS